MTKNLTNRSVVAGLLATAALAAFAADAFAAVAPLDMRSAAEISAAVGAPVKVSRSSATGAVRFLSVQDAASDLAPRPGTPDARARTFFAAHGTLFGIRDVGSELSLASERVDAIGHRHLVYHQFHRGVPVFAGILKAHFDASSRLGTVNGTFVPGIDLDVQPRVAAADAARRAVEFARDRNGRGASDLLSATDPILQIYRLGLDRGIGGESRLVWATTVSNAGDIREFVFVDARSGKIVDWLPGVHDAMNRRAFIGTDGPLPPANSPSAWPSNPNWIEGLSIPSGIQERDNMLISSGDVYARLNALGHDSYDDAGHVMDQAYNRDYGCPNASWNGNLISFCSGFTTHDVTAHEWGHAYTEYTHGLIYRWQSGGLNEAYSDMWGEALDLMTTLTDMTDTDTPNGARTADTCTVGNSAAPYLDINSPAPIAGNYVVGTADFGPVHSATVTDDVVMVVDGAGLDPNDGCEAVTNGGALAGKIAFANRGNCSFYIKTLNAQAANPDILIIGNVPTSANPGTAPGMGCVGDPTCLSSVYTIATVSVNLATANSIRTNIAAPVNASVVGVPAGTDTSVRWIMGEDVTGGALRDMWFPPCDGGSPGKVSDPQYICDGGFDNGGVHFNSGIPNHAFALLVDGGTYNGVTVTSIGVVKAVNLIYRAQTVYQVLNSNFADHEDAMLQSCADLAAGGPVTDPWGGAAQQITAADCLEVQDAMDAVEMSDAPACVFEPLLDPAAPALCATGSPYTVDLFDFESGAQGWVAGSRNIADVATFDPTPWSLDATLPDGRPGQGFFGPDPNEGNCADDDETGVLYIESPAMVMGVGGLPLRLAFDHQLATETAFDGGNVKISVNGGPWTVIPPSAYSFNAQTAALATTGAGNTNPMQGEQAWTGTDDGANDGSWGRTIGDLSSLVSAGQSFRLRYELGRDGCGGVTGWYVDDVNLYVCTAGEAIFVDGFETGGSGEWSDSEP
jgi:Zn-dependent metalloprotease